MQLWLRQFDTLTRVSKLANERTLLAKDGWEFQIEFEKGDRLKWIKRAVSSEPIIKLLKSKGVKPVFVNCLNRELFDRNWASFVFGDQNEDERALSKLFLESYASQLGLPLEWLLDEWDASLPPRPYHRGLLRKFEYLVSAVKQQAMLHCQTSQVHFHDPILANLVEFEIESENADFVHVNSDDFWEGEVFSKPQADSEDRTKLF